MKYRLKPIFESIKPEYLQNLKILGKVLTEFLKEKFYLQDPRFKKKTFKS